MDIGLIVIWSFVLMCFSVYVVLLLKHKIPRHKKNGLSMVAFSIIILLGIVTFSYFLRLKHIFIIMLILYFLAIAIILVVYGDKIFVDKKTKKVMEFKDIYLKDKTEGDKDDK